MAQVVVTASPRKRGLLIIAGGFAIGAAMFVALILLSKIGVIKPDVSERIQNGVVVTKTRYPAFWGIVVVPPLFATLYGLIQVVTGRSFGDFGKVYETTTGFRRFLLSVLVLALALGVISGFVFIAFAIML